MLAERGIERSWAEITIEQPELLEEHDNGIRHYLRRIPEYDNRWLRVVVNCSADPHRKVTVFFDRRLGKKNES
jgi:hypothetical protein